MQKSKVAESIEQRGMRVVRLAKKVPRFQRARETKLLIEAMQRGDNELALWLVRKGFYPHGTDGKGRSVLWWAGTGCRTEIIRELVKRGAALPDDVLTGPINARNKEIVRLLIQKGANVNSIASTYSPIGHFHFKQVALARAINAAAKDPIDESIPLMLIRAGARVNRPMLAASFPGACNKTMLGFAAHHGLLKTVRAMLAAGASINRRDSHGRTALFDALEQGQFAVVRELLGSGAKTNLKDNGGRTPAEALRQQEISPEMNYAQVRLGAGLDVREKELKSLAAAWQKQRARMLVLLERKRPA